MNLRTDDPIIFQRRAKLKPIASTSDRIVRLEPRAKLLPVQWPSRDNRTIVNPRVSHHCEKLVKTRLGDRPGQSTLRELGNTGVGFVVPRWVFPVGVPKQVGTDGNHAPWLS